MCNEANTQWPLHELAQPPVFKDLVLWDDTNMEEKLTLWNQRTSELKARIARLKLEGASKSELRHLRTELEYYFGALKAIKSQIKNA